MIPSIILITRQRVYFHFYVLPVLQISLDTTFFSFLFLFWDSDAFDSQLEHFQNWYIRERNIFSVFLSVLTPAQVSMMHNSATIIKFRKKDQVAKEDKPLCPFRKAFDDFCLKMYHHQQPVKNSDSFNGVSHLSFTAILQKESRMRF